jgi:hypothetical protein
MTNIYIYCIFERDQLLHGVYSSIKAAHRDAMKLCNKGASPVYVRHEGESVIPTVTMLRNIFKGGIDIKVKYVSDRGAATVLKTKLRE